MTIVQIDAGTLTANREDRIVTGLLLPYGEECASNLGKFTFAQGTVDIPTDLRGMSFNVEHAREDVIGNPVSLTDTSAGIVASFSVARTPAGDKALDDIAKGIRKHLSAEVAGVKIAAGIATAGRLFAAALVKTPAFPSATLLAAAADTEEEVIDPDADPDEPDPAAPTTTTATTTEKFIDEAGVERERKTTVSTTIDGDTTTIKTTEVITDPTIEEPETQEDPAVTAATAPKTLTATKAVTKTEDRPLDLRTIYASILAAKSGQMTTEASTMFAALADIKISGTGSLPVGGGAIRENWVGQVWQGKTYERQYINLSKLGTEITASGKKGYRMHRGTVGTPKDILGGDWAGNKVEVPTGSGFTEGLSSTLARFAFAADIAREFYDLPGGTEIVEAFIRLIVEDYAVWSDTKALTATIATAGAAVAPKVYPAQYSGALGQLIQGILAVKKAKDTPTYAIVNETAYEELILTPKDLVPEFVNFAFSTEGTGTADGVVSVVSAEDAAFTTLEPGTSGVLVGAKNAIEFDELGSTPLQIDALELAKGGIDRALHGYLQTFVVRAQSIVLVGETAV